MKYNERVNFPVFFRHYFLKTAKITYISFIGVYAMHAPMVRSVSPIGVISGKKIERKNIKHKAKKNNKNNTKMSSVNDNRFEKNNIIRSKSCRGMIIYDLTTRKVIAGQNETRKIPPASLTKLMTLYATAKAIEQGAISFSDTITFSKEGSRLERIRLGVRPGEKMRLYDAMKAMMICSANDVAYDIGRYVCGNNVSGIFNKYARELRMKDTYFSNATGLYAAGQISTPRDILKLVLAIRRFFPSYLKFSSDRVFPYAGMKKGNTNRLIGTVPGVIGLKTGHLSSCGWHLATFSNYMGHEFIGIFMGYDMHTVRNAEVAHCIRKYNKMLERGEKVERPMLQKSQQMEKNGVVKQGSQPSAVQTTVIPTTAIQTSCDVSNEQQAGKEQQAGSCNKKPVSKPTSDFNIKLVTQKKNIIVKKLHQIVNSKKLKKIYLGKKSTAGKKNKSIMRYKSYKKPLCIKPSYEKFLTQVLSR